MLPPNSHHLPLPLSHLLQPYIPDANMLGEHTRAQIQHPLTNLLLRRSVYHFQNILHLIREELVVSRLANQPHVPSCEPPSFRRRRSP